jgi:hypothetical protein
MAEDTALSLSVDAVIKSSLKPVDADYSILD